MTTEKDGTDRQAISNAVLDDLISGYEAQAKFGPGLAILRNLTIMASTRDNTIMVHHAKERA